MLGRLTYLLSKSKLVVWIALKLRNQLQLIIGYHITTLSDFEKNGEKKIMEYIVQNSKTIIEVGANTGQYLEQLTKLIEQYKKEVSIHTFEPAIHTFKILKENFKNYKNIQCYSIALSNTTGKAMFYQTEQLGEMSSLIQRTKESYQDHYEVELNTIDNLFGNLPTIDFIKIDTEGNDFNVLKGASNLLEQEKIKYIQFEYGDNWRFAGSSLINCIEFLEKYNYQVFLIRPDGLYKLDYTKWKEFYSFANFFACRKSELPAIQAMIKGVF
jgi:FkbM family methyltransferase